MTDDGAGAAIVIGSRFKVIKETEKGLVTYVRTSQCVPNTSDHMAIVDQDANRFWILIYVHLLMTAINKGCSS